MVTGVGEGGEGVQREGFNDGTEMAWSRISDSYSLAQQENLSDKQLCT